MAVLQRVRWELARSFTVGVGVVALRFHRWSMKDRFGEEGLGGRRFEAGGQVAVPFDVVLVARLPVPNVFSNDGGHVAVTTCVIRPERSGLEGGHSEWTQSM